MRSRMTTQLDSARRIGTLEAYRLRAKLGLSPTDRVDIFRLIKEAGIWLRFAPLNRLYGAYQRIGANAGILLHNGHPLNVQRLTAAHEYGHHVLNHSFSADEQASIDGISSSDPREQEAFAFASTLLIPLDGVYAKLPTGGKPGRSWQPSPEYVYRMSAEFGVSYRAVIVQLAALNVISWRYAEVLKRSSPLTVKRALGSGWEPGNPRITVWRFDISDTCGRATVDIGDEIHLYLPVDMHLRTQWQREGLDSSDSIAVLYDDLLSSGMIVPREAQHIVIRALKPGVEQISYTQYGDPKSSRFSLRLDILPDERPIEEGLYLPQQDQLVTFLRA